MINQDYEAVKAKWRQFWNKENHDRPVVTVTAPKNGAVYAPPPAPSALTERWLDIDYVIAASRAGMACTYYGGEAFPNISPNLGPDILGALCGCSLEFGEETSWAVHNVSDWQSHPPILFDPENVWWKKIEAMTAALIADANGDYIVGVTDLHPGTDGLVSLRGPSELCMDLYDCPEEVKLRLEQIFLVFKEVFGRLSAMIGAKQQGSTNWMGVLHPDKDWYVPSSDFSCLVDRELYNEFIAPGLEQEIGYLPASLYHLDGPGALHHLDRILQFEKLDGVQWVPGNGAPPAREWIPVYQKIQAAGKNIFAYCEPEDIEPLCAALNPEGVCLHVSAGVNSEGEANDLLEMARKAAGRRKVQ